MKQTPRTVGEKLFGMRDTLISLIKGAGLAIPPILSYVFNMSDPSVSTAVFLSIVMSLIHFMLTDRSTDYFFKRLGHNRFLFIVSIICIILSVVIATTGLSSLFGMVTISGTAFITSILLPLLIPVVFESVKIYKNIFKAK